MKGLLRNMNFKKSRIEKEYTFYKPLINNPKDEFVAILDDVFNIKLWDISYEERVEFRYSDSEWDKSKYIFKINHGEIYYRINCKKRNSNLDDDLQIYDEYVTNWDNIDNLENFEFIKSIIYIAFKRIYKHKQKKDSEVQTFSMQVIDFLDLDFSIIGNMNYFEIEGLSYFPKDLIFNYGYYKLNNYMCKTKLGYMNNNSSINCKIDSIETLRKAIYTISLFCNKREFFEQK